MSKVNTARAKVILFKSKTLKDGTHPVMLRVTHKQKRYHYSTSYYFTPNTWNRIISDDCPPSLEETKLEVIGIQTEAIRTKKLIELELGYFSISEFEKRLFPSEEENEVQLIESLQRALSRCEEKSEISPRTIESYGNAISALRRFEKYSLTNKRQKVFYLQDISKEVVTDFETYLQKQNELLSSKKKPCNKNTVGIYTASFRALYNRAIRHHEFTPSPHPFEGYRRKKELSNPRGLSKDDIIKFYQYPTKKDTTEWLAQQYFIFSYLNQGMNFTDLAKLKWSDLGQKRLIYTRNKTLKHLEPDTFSIKITDEISLILSYFKNHRDTFQNYVFPIIDGNYSEQEIIRKINHKVSNVNDHLKQIGKALGIEQKITTYVARHSYATTLLNNDVPLHVIQEKLGHKDVRTTRGYAKRLNFGSLDKVNENLL